MYRIVLITAAIFFASCINFNANKIKGNNNSVVKKRDIEAADKIKINSGDIDLELVDGNIFQVSVTADENLHKHIETISDNGTIEIGTENNEKLISKNPVKVIIQLPVLHSLYVSGSSDVNSVGKLKNSESIHILSSGSADIDLHVNAPEIKTNIMGSSDVKLSGETRDLVVSINGSGDLNASDLKAENTKITINGSGDATVFSDVFLKAAINGSGNVYYSGKANTETVINGSGSVEKKN